jgi:hypothetical protein
VDVVGRHLQFSLQLCTKVTENCLGKPRTGIDLHPVIHFNNRDIDTSPAKMFNTIDSGEYYT